MAAIKINEETNLIIPKGVLNPTQTAIIRIPSKLYNTGPLVVVQNRQHNHTLNRNVNLATHHGKTVNSVHNPQRKPSELERLFLENKPLASKIPQHRSSNVNQAIQRKTAQINVVPHQMRATTGLTEMTKKPTLSPKTNEITTGRSRTSSLRLPSTPNDPKHVLPAKKKQPSDINYPTNFIKCPPDYPGVLNRVVNNRGCSKLESVAEIRSKLYSPVNNGNLSRNNGPLSVKSVAGSLRIQPRDVSTTNRQIRERERLKKSVEKYCSNPMRYATAVPVRIVG